MSRTEPQPLDLLGVGFGPSNLALAALLEERRPMPGEPLSRLFLDRQESFCWHPGMLLEGARIQISFLKDLVTLNDPRSRFTFLNYLRVRGRLDEFVNLRTFTPSRREFNDYYRWVAEQLDDRVRYGVRVLSVRPGRRGPGGTIAELEVTAEELATSRRRAYRTRNAVIATGGVPHLPPGVSSSPRVVHSSRFETAMGRFADRRRPWRFAVVGSGQSAAEIFHELICRYPEADVTAAIRGFAFKPADSSHFVNEIFFPQTSDLLLGLDAEARGRILETHWDTNYSAVEEELIETLYRRLYEERLGRRDRARVLPFVELRGADEQPDGVLLRFRNRLHDTDVERTVDAVVLATGFRRPRRHPLLRPLLPWLTPEGDGFRVGRDYRVAADAELAAGVFLQGFCEATHGLGETLLSQVPVRAARIAEALEERSSVGLRPAAGSAGRAG